MKYLLCVMSGVVITLLFLYFYSPSEKPVSYSIKFDTVKIVKTPDPIILEKVKAKLVYVKDTIIKTKPFISKIDTIVKMDTVFVSYKYPENKFSLAFKPIPDTLKKFYHVPIHQTTYEKNDRFWMLGLGFMGGILLTSIIK